VVLRASRLWFLGLGLAACGGGDGGGGGAATDAALDDRGIAPPTEDVGPAGGTGGERPPEDDAAVGGGGGTGGTGGTPPDGGPRFACADGIDNDADGLIDLRDPGCVGPEDTDETDAVSVPQCSNGLDDDEDGLPDLADPNCTGESDPSEQGENEVTGCTNEVDDDGDGLIDFPNDPGCRAAGDDTEDSDAVGERPTCANALDDDGDGATDYPEDPGCQGLGDMNEADPAVAPVCANGLDDDEDGAIDYPDDTGCVAAGDPNEFGACGPQLVALDLNTALAADGFYDGTLEGGSATLAGSCGGGSGPERIFQYRLDRRVSALVFSTNHPETTKPTVLYVRTGCLDPVDVACNRGAEATPGTEVRLERPAPGLYFVVVDTSSVALGPGPFRLTVDQVAAPACDDGVDNDEDGALDLNDRGCVDFADLDETDEGMPACGNGLDDDGDGFTDYPSDPDCEAAGGVLEGPVCNPAYALVPVELPGGEFQVNLGLGEGLTASNCGPGIGLETVVAVLVEEASRVRFSALANDEGDLQASVRRGCDDPATEVDCAAGLFGQAVDFEFETEGPETLYFIVEASADDFFGPAASATVRVDIESLITGCSDAADNDDDGLVDLFDPGCKGPQDDSERDPAAPPACADDADNDADGRVDYPQDEGCLAAGDTDEAIGCAFTEDLVILPAEGGRVPLDFGQDVYDASCAGEGSDAVVAFTVSVPSEVLVRTVTGDFDTVLAVLNECAVGAELDCDDDGGEAPLSELTFDRLQPGVYFAVVQAFRGAPTAAELEVAIFPDAPPACADAVDNDGDALVDALDPGCTGALDTNEADAPAPPACANGLDDDEDGLVDHPADPECGAAGSPTEAGRCLDGRPVLEVGQAGGRFGAAFANLENATALSCQPGMGGELPLVLTLDERSRVRIGASTRRGEPLSAAISVRTGCGEEGRPDEELACGDAFSGPLVVRELQAGTYYVFVEPSAGIEVNGFVDIQVDSLVRACNDTRDNDEDGLTDAADPGCALGNDDDETDPAVPTACSDGVDNDGDGLTDFPEDPECAFAGATLETLRCGPAVPVVEGGIDVEINVEFDDARDFFAPRCANDVGPDVVIALEVEVVSDLVVSVVGDGGATEYALALRDACPDGGFELTCATEFDAELSAYRVEPGTYLLYVQRPDFVADPTARVTIARRPVVTACSDGLDNDNDAVVDALDPGCETHVDVDEADLADPPHCADGVDNDGDAAIDFPADLDCRALGGVAEEKRCPAGTTVVQVGPAGGVFNADLTVGASLGTGACLFGNSRFIAYAVRIEELSRLTVTAPDDGFFGVDLLLRTDCLASVERACVEDFGEARLSAEVEAGLYYVLVGSNPRSDPPPFPVTITIESLIVECNDGLDNDEDGANDLADPGCAGDRDDDETDPEVAPVCADGLDNDDDGDIDYPDDAACIAAGGTSESASCDLVQVAAILGDAGGVVQTDTTGGVDLYNGASCGGGGEGPEEVIALVLSAPAAVTATILDGDYDTVLFVRDLCDGGEELACNDDGEFGLLSDLAFPRLDAGTYYFYVDGFLGRSGTAEIEFIVTPL